MPTLVGTEGDDVIVGTGDDTIDALSGNDSISVGSGRNIVNAGRGDDVIMLSRVGDRIDGGEGFDTIDASAIPIEPNSGLSFRWVLDEATNDINLVLGRPLRGGFFQVFETTKTINIEKIIASDLGGSFLFNLLSRSIEIVGGRSFDGIITGSGDDRITGGGGRNVISGGEGFDTAIYQGLRRQYVSDFSNVIGGYEQSDDDLSGIDELEFIDGSVTRDGESIAAQVMRLYDATLDRQPDQTGFDIQVRALASGKATLLSLANAFVSSSEFQARYGSLSNQQFVEQLYRFCLNREGEAAGVAVQVNALSTGTSRAALVVAFSESPEHRTLTQSILNAGLWVADERALQIARLYDATLDRLPDAAGLAGQLAALNGGTSLLQLAANFVGSPEFQSRYGSLSNQQFVEQLYRFCLDREGDAAGIAAQVNALNTGTSRAQLVLAFSESAEHVALTAALYSGGIRTNDPVSNVAPAHEEGGKAHGQRPQVLVQAEDATTWGKAEEALVLPEDGASDTQRSVAGFNVVDDPFALPEEADLPLLVLPEADLLDTVALEQVSLPSNLGNRMLTLPMSGDGMADHTALWLRNSDHDGWMLQ